MIKQNIPTWIIFLQQNCLVTSFYILNVTRMIPSNENLFKLIVCFCLIACRNDFPMKYKIDFINGEKLQHPGCSWCNVKDTMKQNQSIFFLAGEGLVSKLLSINVVI